MTHTRLIYPCNAAFRVSYHIFNHQIHIFNHQIEPFHREIDLFPPGLAMLHAMTRGALAASCQGSKMMLCHTDSFASSVHARLGCKTKHSLAKERAEMPRS